MGMEMKTGKINQVLEMDGGDGCPKTRNVLNATELYTLKWLSCEILHCLFYHGFKKQKEKQSFSTFSGRMWDQPALINSMCSYRFYKAHEDTAFTQNQGLCLLHTVGLTLDKNLGYSKL